MDRDRMQVLVGALASLGLIIAGALVMDWYQRLPGGVAGGARSIAIGLRDVKICGSAGACTTAPLTPLSGMFPTLATVTLWSSLGFAALVVFQAVSRVFTGDTNGALARLGYLLALVTISLTAATAYLFGLEPESIGPELAAQVGLALHRTWAPLILLAGHVAGFATIYMAVAPESGDLGAVGTPVTFVPAREVPDGRAAPGSMTTPRPGSSASPGSATLDPRAPSGVVSPSVRSKAATLPPIPEHLRNRLSYVAITAELTAGGIDARREDGSSRLVLWRDVVGVVARRMPPAYGNATFIDIVSTAGSTLRIVPWTRLTGEPIDADADPGARPRRVVERVVARCPDARLDPATQEFLHAGEAAQLPDQETLQAHDDRLA